MYLSEKLKEETAQSHRMIEKVPAFRKLMSPELNKQEYIKLLQGWLSFIQPIEEKLLIIENLNSLIDDFELRKKVHLLESDLNNLEGKNLPVYYCNDTPECSNLADCIGLLYVIEGSSLGAQIISNRIAKHDYVNTNTSHFYNGYGSQTMHYWKKFKKAIDQWGNDHPELHNDAIEKAKDCFLKLSCHMAKI